RAYARFAFHPIRGVRDASPDSTRPARSAVGIRRERLRQTAGAAPRGGAQQRRVRAAGAGPRRDTRRGRTALPRAERTGTRRLPAPAGGCPAPASAGRVHADAATRSTRLSGSRCRGAERAHAAHDRAVDTVASKTLAGSAAGAMAHVDHGIEPVRTRAAAAVDIVQLHHRVEAFIAIGVEERLQ